MLLSDLWILMVFQNSPRINKQAAPCIYLLEHLRYKGDWMCRETLRFLWNTINKQLWQLGHVPCTFFAVWWCVFLTFVGNWSNVGNVMSCFDVSGELEFVRKYQCCFCFYVVFLSVSQKQSRILLLDSPFDTYIQQSLSQKRQRNQFISDSGLNRP